ncbi:MAG: 5'-nucleotidase C-terminal domain-containing protein, partial [Rubricella sp.]
MPRLRLLATTDLHMALHAHDDIADRPVARGLEALAPLIASERAGAEASLLLDNGDLLQGAPMGEWHAREAPDSPHPMLAAMGQIGFDAGTLGNHEFDFGVDYLAAQIAGAPHPVLCCNIEIDPPLPIRRSIIVERDLGGRPLRIGITGTVPPRILVWSRHMLEGRCTVRLPWDAVAEEAAAMRSAGADIVVCLSHGGIVPEGHFEEAGENSALLIAQTGAVDAIVCGHQHYLFPHPEFPRPGEGIDAQKGRLAGVPAIMPGSSGSHLGRIDLDLVHDGHWRVAGADVSLLPAPETPPETPASLSRHWAEAARGTAARLSRPVGHTDAPITTAFALLEDARALRLIHAAQLWGMKRLYDGTLPVLSAASPFKSGGRGGAGHYTDIPAGPVDRRAIADLYPYENAFVGIEVTRATLRDWLEMSAGIFATLAPGEVREMILPHRPGFNYDAIAGVAYAIDLGAEPAFDDHGTPTGHAGRIRDLTFEGRDVKADDRFIVATNTYRAGGGGNFPGLPDCPVRVGPDRPVVEILTEYIAAMGTADLPDPSWHLTGPEGAEGLYL